MSTEQPENDPFRKRPQPDEPGSGGPPPGEQSPGEPPPERPPPPPPGGAGGPYASPQGAPPPGAPYSDSYGGAGADPLAGMPPLGSRGRRLLARIVDALIVGIPVGIVSGLVSGFDSYDDAGAQYWQGGFYTLVYFLYEGLMLTRSGQTVGKKLMKIRVAVLQNGAAPHGTPGWVRAAVYSIPALVPCLGFLFWLINVLYCTWDKPYHQCLHDKAAKTVVVVAD
ncbi:RDD family protein [Streptomyces sp. DSM 42041]|uniref:RDD family protein n=1 Tax=Streptomyces hazeniae TaxID=3075538 RepID=A0ABU2NLM5_9ACTN|nr:RDD family protein [Streptomyces sp. DSM 42041]MDT0377876.1 RDD family protein [Streptomyces sp. DSM 42041]